jgi:ATP-dependent Clp protease protease subunit
MRRQSKKGAGNMRNWFSMKMRENVDPDDDEDEDAENGENGENGDKKDKQKPAKTGAPEDDEDVDENEQTKKKKYVEITIYDEIGKSFWNDEAISAKDFITNLAEMGDDFEDIELRINSPGGDVFDGVAIHNALKNHKAKVRARIDGIAGSIASYIAMAADEIIMPANTFMLLHNAAGFVMGTAEDMHALAADLERIDKTITATYAKRSGQTPAAVRALMKEDRLMDAKEAKQLGLADTMVPEVAMAANYSLRWLPKQAAETLRKMQLEPAEPQPKPATTGAVITLGAARKQGMADHKKYVENVTDLCALAGMPEKVGDFIRNETPPAQVRKELLEARSKAEPVMPQNPLLERKSAASLWDNIVAKLNARTLPRGA